MIIICTQTGDESIAETTVYKLTSREHRTYSTGDSNNNIMAYYGLRSPCEAASLRGVRQRTLVSTSKLKYLNTELLTQNYN